MRLITEDHLCWDLEALLTVQPQRTDPSQHGLLHHQLVPAAALGLLLTRLGRWADGDALEGCESLVTDSDEAQRAGNCLYRGSRDPHLGLLHGKAQSDPLQGLGRVDKVRHFYLLLRLGGTVDVDVVDLLALQDDGEGAGGLPVSLGHLGLELDSLERH